MLFKYVNMLNKDNLYVHYLTVAKQHFMIIQQDSLMLVVVVHIV